MLMYMLAHVDVVVQSSTRTRTQAYVDEVCTYRIISYHTIHKYHSICIVMLM